ncbi:hypothetical protein A3K72_02230 [Candidatus Woesearchaeota archaeon RBG_13_36_6]|nr:MAG: hypothetical protein A3K72_02230 [Candidatus Woesearchaeota archaeon RBG_13_36_6]
MGYKYLDHEADIGIAAWGTSLKSAFTDGAKAMFNVMVNIEKIKPNKRVEIECSALDIPGLFVEWLNELLTQKDLNDLFFSEFEIEYINEEPGGYSLKGFAIGEDIDVNKHEIKTEVKGATYSGLKYGIKEGKHYIQCVLDI